MCVLKYITEGHSAMAGIGLPLMHLFIHTYVLPRNHGISDLVPTTWPITDPNSKLVLHHYALPESRNCPSFPFKVNMVFMVIRAGNTEKIMETRNAYKILVNNFPGKRSLKY
jgi:hypothetical protein